MNQGTWVAIDASTDRRSWASTLAHAHDEFVGGAPPAQLLRSPIASSWRRSASAGIDPGRGIAPLKLSADQASERWAQHPLSVAEPMLRELLADVRSDDDQVVLICDADGALLWIDGEPAVLEAAHEIHLEPGALWSEDAAGTNAMGTALEIDHPIQIFSAEHFAQSVHGWTCCAAPVNDPETGRRLGVIDLSGEISTAHPHSLALIEAAARMTEAELQRRLGERHARIRDRWTGRIGDGRGRPSALASSAGTVLVAHDDAWVGRRVELPAEGGAVELPDGVVVHAEPTPGGDAFLLWRAADAAPGRAEPARALRIDALGRD
jgi:transcriptional regulator of acetoin/glycerol metabolism